jgi:hypothetical protein
MTGKVPWIAHAERMDRFPVMHSYFEAMAAVADI